MGDLMRRFLLAAGLIVLLATPAGAIELPVASKSALADIAFPDRPVILPQEAGFATSIIAVGNELARPCQATESFGWKLASSEQDRLNSIFTGVFEGLRASGYSVREQSPASVSGGISVFTADKANTHVNMLWSAGDQGLVLVMCRTDRIGMASGPMVEKPHLPSPNAARTVKATDADAPIAAPPQCKSTTLNWSVDGANCTATVDTTPSGSMTAAMASSPNTGTAIFACLVDKGAPEGRFVQQGGATCSVPAPPMPKNCDGQTVQWENDGASCEARIETTPLGSSTTVQASAPNTGTALFTCQGIAGEKTGSFKQQGPAKCVVPPKPLPKNCPAGTVSWLVDGHSCTASVGASDLGAVLRPQSSNDSVGAATYICNGKPGDEVGHYDLQNGATCSAPPPKSCAAASLTWTVGDMSCNGRVNEVMPGTETTVISTNGNKGKSGFKCVADSKGNSSFIQQDGATCLASIIAPAEKPVEKPVAAAPATTTLSAPVASGTKPAASLSLPRVQSDLPPKAAPPVAALAGRPVISPLAAQPAPQDRRLLQKAMRLTPGEWEGRYSCAQGQTGASLKITSVSKDAVKGVFTFFAPPHNPDIASGSYEVSGPYDPETGRMVLAPGKWIKHPKDYFSTTILGQLDPMNEYFRGIFQGSVGCTSIEAKRVEAGASLRNNSEKLKALPPAPTPPKPAALKKQMKEKAAEKAAGAKAHAEKATGVAPSHASDLESPGDDTVYQPNP
jgi:hypothetical protein